MKIILKSVCLSAFFGGAAMAELTITGAAINTASLGDKDGNVLPSTARVEIGFYSSGVTRSQLEAFTSASSFLTDWTSMAVGTATAFDIQGLTSVSVNLPTGQNSYFGKQMYFLIGNSTTIAGSSQLGVFTSSSWIVPTNPTSEVPDVWDFDISTAAQILFGSFQATQGITYNDGTANIILDEYRLQAVIPEPNTFALLLGGLTALLVARRRSVSND